jgi:thiosulfate/3-mercaptopyruvate sulfurtransferase
LNVRKLIFIFTFLLPSGIAWPAQASSQNLVETEWLAENLKNPEIVLIDMSDNLQYQRFHIPGAVNLPYSYLNQSKNKVSLSIGQDLLVKLLGQLGITQQTHVIAYDDTGGLNAARLLWELEQLGHPKMSLLNGGLVKWIREGRMVAYQQPTIRPRTYTPRKTGQQATATLNDVSSAGKNETLLLDVRTPEEYTGNPRYPRTGHIPGARHWPWDQALDLNKGFTLHDARFLQQELHEAGLTNKKQPVIVYCRSGHRATHAYFTLRELGFENVRVYDGSMKEYEQHKELPLKMGNEP